MKNPFLDLLNLCPDWKTRCKVEDWIKNNTKQFGVSFHISDGEIEYVKEQLHCIEEYYEKKCAYQLGEAIIKYAKKGSWPSGDGVTTDYMVICLNLK